MESGLLIKMAYSRVGAGKVKDETGIFYYTRQKIRNMQRMMGTCQKITEVYLNRVPTGQNGDHRNNRMMLLTGYEFMNLL